MRTAERGNTADELLRRIGQLERLRERDHIDHLEVVGVLHLVAEDEDVAGARLGILWREPGSALHRAPGTLVRGMHTGRMCSRGIALQGTLPVS